MELLLLVLPSAAVNGVEGVELKASRENMEEVFPRRRANALLDAEDSVGPTFAVDSLDAALKKEEEVGSDKLGTPIEIPVEPIEHEISRFTRKQRNTVANSSMIMM